MMNGENFKKRIVKKAVKKRVIEPETKKENMFELPYCKNPPIISIYAYYDSNKFAFYSNKETPTNDYFYLALNNFKNQHIKYIGDDIPSYNSSFTAQGFKYKPMSKFIKFVDKHGQFLQESECVGKKVSMKIKVKPYDFISKTTGKRTVGISIQVQEIMRM